MRRPLEPLMGLHIYLGLVFSSAVSASYFEEMCLGTLLIKDVSVFPICI